MRKSGWRLRWDGADRVAPTAQAADFATEFAQPAGSAAEVPLVVAERVGGQRGDPGELDQMADAGFGGAEIADVHHSATAARPRGHGWGTEAWTYAMQAALRGQGARDDGRPHRRAELASAVPSVTPDSAGAIKELAYGIASRGAGHDVRRPPAAAGRSLPRPRSRSRSCSTSKPPRSRRSAPAQDGVHARRLDGDRRPDRE